MSRGRRIAVIGATGALGSEVLACLDEAGIETAELVPVATDRSLGEEIEFRGELHPVETQLRSLRGLDWIFLCAPPGPSLDYARKALHAEVPAIDLSGALAGNDDVPLRVAAFGDAAEGRRQPLVASPPAGALAWALALRPLAERAGLRRVVGTVLEAASVGGREGIESLYAESLALFNQEDLPEPRAFERPVAFDCLPSIGPIGHDGRSDRERSLLGGLARLFGDAVGFDASSVQVPTFVGYGAALHIETTEPLEAKQAREVLAAAPGLELWEAEDDPLTTRAATGRDAVLVGRVRADASRDGGLVLWLAADLLRLAAANGVAVARARLAAH